MNEPVTPEELAPSAEGLPAGESPVLEKPPVPLVKDQRQPQSPASRAGEVHDAARRARAARRDAVLALPRWMRLFFWLFGVSGASPERLRLAELCTMTAMRTREAWIIPACATMVLFLGLLGYHLTTSREGEDGFEFMLGRVFVFDYLLFVLTWVSGYGMARRWRTNQEMVEELTLSSIRPQSLSTAFVIGSLVPWFWMLFAFFAFESLLFMTGDVMDMVSQGGLFEGDPLRAMPVALAQTLLRMPGILVFAWFHFATVRLAHSMFALGALPKVHLRRLAVANLLMIGLLVLFLSGVGSAITGIAAVMLMVPASVGSVGGDFGMGHNIWLYASIPGMLTVVVLKNMIANRYLTTFQRQWVMFQWWGAAEIEHPPSYPPAYYPAADMWIAYGDAMDEAEAGVPPSGRKCARRYQQQMARWRNNRQQVVDGFRPNADPLERRFGE